MPRLDPRAEAVAQRVLDERLHDERRDACAGGVRREIDRHGEPIAESHALDVEVLLDEPHLLAERLVRGPRVEDVPQQVAEARDQPDDAGIVARTGERGDAVERIEEEVRLKLRAERVEPRGRELRLEPRRGDLPLAVALVQRERLADGGNRE